MSEEAADEFMANLSLPVEELDPELAKYRYEDDTLGTCIKHPLYFSVLHPPQMNRNANRALKIKKAALIEYHGEKKWGAYIGIHERAYRINAFEEIAHLLSDEDYWQLLGETWTDSENIHEMEAKWSMLLMSERPLREQIMDEEDRVALAALPETFTVYRGFCLDGRGRGFSWTLSLGQAIWFAQRHDLDGSARVVEGEVKRDNVIAYFSDRGEEEIVVHPDKVTVKHERWHGSTMQRARHA